MSWNQQAVMASTTRDQPLTISSATAATAPEVAVGTTLMMAAAGSSGDRQHSTSLFIEREDVATKGVVAESMSSNGQAPTPKPYSTSMHPLLLAAACNGDWEGLNFLLKREETASQVFLEQLAPYTDGSLAMEEEEATSDVEQGDTTPLMSAASLLEGVTVEGYTALHVVAANGVGDNFLKCANLIYGMAPNHLSALNNKGDTPLHCAARGLKSQMVSHLIDLASRRDDTGDDRSVKEFVRKENHQKETALHEAVRIGDNHIVEVLLTVDPELASFPEGYTSPLYLAILSENHIIAQTLYNKSKGSALSYAGPNGQNALHAAVVRGKVPTNMLLQWNKRLATLSDEKGSTPLHFAAALSSQQWSVCLHVFEANPRALYHSDRDGMFPIHVAASVGAKEVIIMFLRKYPSSAGLRDARGRTFLHIAVDKQKVEIVRYACRTQGLTWILNMQDNDGNTALHLAVQAGGLRVFCALYGDRLLHLNLINHKGQTPLDISRYKMLPGIHYIESSEERICKALRFAGSMSGASRQDYFQETYEHIHQLKTDGESKRLDKLKDSTQTLCIGSVLIATVTFSVTFAVPGGYRADDHTNGGAPTLAGRYTFDAFIVANTLAFICSAIATIGLIFSGISMNDLLTRQIYFAVSIVSMSSSVTSLTAAFAIGVYMVLAPVAHKTAIVICVMSPLILLWGNSEHWLKCALILQSVRCRMGLFHKALLISAVEIFAYVFLEFWPLLFIFSWPAIARNHQHH